MDIEPLTPSQKRMLVIFFVMLLFANALVFLGVYSSLERKQKLSHAETTTP